MKKLILSAVAISSFVLPAFAQDSVQMSVLKYRSHVEGDKIAPLRLARYPQRSDYVVIVDRAQKKATQLLNSKRTLDDKMTDLLSSNIGRWAATESRNVSTLVSFSMDSIEFSERAVSDRLG